MLVEQQVAEGAVDEVHGEEVNSVDAAEGDVSAAHAEVPTANEEPSISSHTPPTPPPQPSHDIPLTSQAQPTPPHSPQVQPPSPQPQQQPHTSQDAGIPMNLLQEVMDTCTALSRRVKHLELDKIAHALEITKLKRRVKKLERRNKVKVLKLRRLQKVGTTQRIETSDETVMDDVSNQGRMIAEMDKDVDVVLEEAKEIPDDSKVDHDADVNENDDIQGRTAESQAEFKRLAWIMLISETITAASTNITTDEAQVTAVTLTAAPSRVTTAPSKRRKGVVIRDPEESTTPSTIILAETKSKDIGKGILIEEPKPLKKQA
nr:hypothetical protein [Tanacetum cinerariifolium]